MLLQCKKSPPPKQYRPLLTIRAVSHSSDMAYGEILDKYRPDLRPFEDVYRRLHSSPELSGQEEQTAAVAAEFLTDLGYEVHTHIGGYGVAGVLRNGPGPTVLVRADMDGLPVEEKTGLPYASKKRVKDVRDGLVKHVMHACGHDTHVTTLAAAATLLHSARSHWSGTLVCIFQPAEEHLDGAKAMILDGLYEKVPKPDYVLAQHVMRMRTGSVGICAGPMLTASDALDVRIFGKGGHGSAPHVCIDPVLIGASIVTRLQSIVSREVIPGQLAVVTCGSIHAGNAANVIPDHLDLQLSIRTYNPIIRERVLAAVHRIIEAECEAAGTKEKPVIKTVSSAPATVNDEDMVKILRTTFYSYFKEDLIEAKPATASEDFSLLATEVGAPYVMWGFGGTDAKTWDDAVAKGTVDKLPSNHSPYFAPVIEPTLRTGVDAMALAALTFLRGKTSSQ